MKKNFLSESLLTIGLRDEDDGPVVQTFEIRTKHILLLICLGTLCVWLSGCTDTKPIFGGNPPANYFSTQARYHRLTGRRDSCREWVQVDTTHALIGIFLVSGGSEQWYDGLILDSLHKTCLAENHPLGRRVIYYDSAGRAFSPPNEYYEFRKLPSPFIMPRMQFHGDLKFQVHGEGFYIDPHRHDLPYGEPIYLDSHGRGH